MNYDEQVKEQELSIREILVDQGGKFKNLAEYIVLEKKRTAKILHAIYGITILLLLIILSQNI